MEADPPGAIETEKKAISLLPPGLSDSMQLADASQVVMVGSTAQLTATATLPDRHSPSARCRSPYPSATWMGTGPSTSL